MPADQETGSAAQTYSHLFPELFYSTFVDDGVRPDGRPLGRGRAVTIGLGAISAGKADGSALVKLGNTSVLAGVRLELGRPDDTSPDQGLLKLNIELASFSCPDTRAPAAVADAAATLHRLSDVLHTVLDLHQLAIHQSKSTCWHILLDVYVLDCDGCTFDTALLAAVAALLDTRVPAVLVSKDGRVRRQGDCTGTNAAVAAADDEDIGGKRGTGDLTNTADEDDPLDGSSGAATSASSRRLQLPAVPLSLTCCLFKQHVVVDPTSEEEAVAPCLVSMVMDGQGVLRGVFKTGQKQRADVMTLRRCMEAAKLRYKEVSAMLAQAQQQA